MSMTDGGAHLRQWEDEGIFIIRETAAECERPVLLYSIGKDISKRHHAFFRLHGARRSACCQADLVFRTPTATG